MRTLGIIGLFCAGLLCLDTVNGLPVTQSYLGSARNSHDYHEFPYDDLKNAVRMPYELKNQPITPDGFEHVNSHGAYPDDPRTLNDIGDTTTMVLRLLPMFHIVSSREQNRDEVPSADNHGHCNMPLGTARNSINIQVGFELSPPDGHPDTVSGPGSDADMLGTRGERQDRTYIQVEFPAPRLISGMLTQGSPTSPARVTRFQVLHSRDCSHYTPVTREDGQVLEFASNLDPNTTSLTMFDDLFLVKCVSIVPTRTVGDETALIFQLIGCDIEHCQHEIEPSEVLENNNWKRVMFRSEKIVTSITISVHPGAAVGQPSFLVAYSRTCSFRGIGVNVIRENGAPRVFVLESGATSITIDDEHVFPVRAQCVAVFSPEAEQASPEIPDPTDGPLPLSSLSLDDFDLSFTGCDAQEKHAAIDSCGKSRLSPNRPDLNLQPSRRHREKRVVGGLPSLPGQWPWLVSLHFLQPHQFTDVSGLRHLCGASLIHPEWLLTAAHCFHDLLGEGLSDKTNWRVILGEHNQANPDGTEQILTIREVFVHPNFTLDEDEEILWDIALVWLSRPATLSDYVNTVCVEPDQRFPAGTECVTAGWGYTQVENGRGVELPNHAEVKIVSQSECARCYNSLPDGHEAKTTVAIVDSVMCAMAEHNGTDSCSGDSGGPLICYHGDHWTQVGIVSLGYECGDVRYPGIYTRVNYFYDWIMGIVNNNTPAE